MFTIPKNTGSNQSRVKTDYGTLYFTQFDDGRFEYYGLLELPAKVSFANINYPIKIIDAVGVATNFYATTNTAIASMTCSWERARVDVAMPSGEALTSMTRVNIMIKGKWK